MLEDNRLRQPAYLNNGRWYTLFIESDGSTPQITSADITAEISGSLLKFPSGFSVVDVKYDIHSVEGASGVNTYFEHRIESDGRQSIFLIKEEQYDYMTIYVFGHF